MNTRTIHLQLGSKLVELEVEFEYQAPFAGVFTGHPDDRMEATPEVFEIISLYDIEGQRVVYHYAEDKFGMIELLHDDIVAEIKKAKF